MAGMRNYGRKTVGKVLQSQRSKKKEEKKAYEVERRAGNTMKTEEKKRKSLFHLRSCDIEIYKKKYKKKVVPGGYYTHVQNPFQVGNKRELRVLSICFNT